MYIEDMAVFLKNEKEQETLIQTIRIYIQDIGTEFSIGKEYYVFIKMGKEKQWKE